MTLTLADIYNRDLVSREWLREKILNVAPYQYHINELGMMMKEHCSYCNRRNKPDADECAGCGAPL